VKLPTPEELGVGARSAEQSDWTPGYRRLCDLGATSFQFTRLPQGGCRVSCVLPTAQPDRNHRIDAEAATEFEAIRLAVGAAEEWVTRKR
jgi:hypothetical protein